MNSLLAVDLGVRTGFALYGSDGRLRWYRSQNFGSLQRLRRGAHRVLNDLPDLAWIVLEGGGALAEIWEREAEKRLIALLRIDAETWRRQFLYPRQRRTGSLAKESADDIARRIISWSGAPKPTSLRHDAAEAILTGLWGVIQVGWLPAVPSDVLTGPVAPIL